MISEYNVAMKNIEGYENYAIAEDGFVINLKTNRVLQRSLASVGYHVVNLSKEGKHKTFLVHKLVADAFLPTDEVRQCIDHIDNDRTNNRRENLRRCTYSENSQNRSMKMTRKEFIKHKGVYKIGKKFVAKLMHNKKIHYLGYFETEDDAGKAYNAGAIKLFGDFAKLNKI